MISKVHNSYALNKARIFFFLALVFALLWTCAAIPRLSLPLGLSYILTMMIRPFVPFFSKLGLGRVGAHIAIVLILLCLLILPIFKVGPALRDEGARIQTYLPKVERLAIEKLEKIRGIILEKARYDIGTDHLDRAFVWGEREITNVLLRIPNLVASILEWIFIVPLFVFFILKDGHRFKMLFLRVVPNPFFERSYTIVHEFNRKLSNYIFAKFVEASFVGLQITLGLLIIGLKFPLLLGLIAGVTNVVPYIGPLLGIIPAIIVCLIDFSGQGQLFWVLMLYLVANVIDIALIFPLLVSKVVDIHPMVVVASVILGSQYFGMAGMVLSVPMAAVVKLIVLETYQSLYPRGIHQQE